MIRPSAPRLRVGFFTECYRPIVNGVVASIDALRVGLSSANVAVTTFAPEVPHYRDSDASIVRMPSLPLPTSTAYRLCLPYVRASDRAQLEAIDIVHAHSSFVSGWYARAAARKRSLPLVFTYHTRIDEYAHYAPFERKATRAAMLALTRSFANSAAAVVVPTAAMEVRLREIGVESPIAIVPSSIDVVRFATGRRSATVRALLGAEREMRVALLVSRLAREKNIELAIDALAQVDDVHLAVVGDGPHRDALEARVRERRIEGRVRFVGALPPEALPDIYASSDAFVFPSLTETQGLVLAEALASGLPIVAVDSPAMHDVLELQARLVPASAGAFGAAMREAAFAGRSAGAVAAAFERFGHELQTTRMLELYTQLHERVGGIVPPIWHTQAQ